LENDFFALTEDELLLKYKYEEKLIDESYNVTKVTKNADIGAAFVRIIADTPLEEHSYTINDSDENIHNRCKLQPTAMGSDTLGLGAGADKRDAGPIISNLLRTFRDLVKEKTLRDPGLRDYSFNLPPDIKTVFIKNEVKLLKKVGDSLQAKLPRTIINDGVISLCICYLLFFNILEDSKKTQMDGNGIGVSNFHGGPEQIFRTMFKRTNLKRVEEKVEKMTKKELDDMFDWFPADVVEWDKSLRASDMAYVVLKMYLKINWHAALKAGMGHFNYIYSLFMYFQRWFIGNLISLSTDKSVPLLCFLGTMPSGTYLTAYGNSEANNYKATKLQWLLIDAYVRLGGSYDDLELGSMLMFLSYGDDLILAMLKSVRRKMGITDRIFQAFVKLAYRMQFKDEFISKKFFTELVGVQPKELQVQFLKNYFILEGESVYTFRENKDIIPKVFVSAQNISSTIQACVRSIGIAYCCGKNLEAYEVVKGLYDRMKPDFKVIVDQKTMNMTKISFKVAGIMKDLVNHALDFPSYTHILSKQIMSWKEKNNIDVGDEVYMEQHGFNNC